MCNEHRDTQNDASAAAQQNVVATASAFFRSGLVVGAALVGQRLLAASPGLSALLGGGILDDTCFLDHVVEKDRLRTAADIDASLSLGRIEPISCSLKHADGRHVPVELRVAATDLCGERAALVSVQDLTERIAAEQRLRAIAHYDHLTRLPNRILLQDRLSQGIAAAERNARMLALLVIDLDGFKAVNDAHGHSAGDAALREAACRFSKCIRAADTLARVGGDEFVVVLPDLVRRVDAGIIAARTINALRSPLFVGQAEARIGASIGISIYPDDGTDIDLLFARADSAMYAAKRAGKNQYAFADGSATVVLATDRCEWSAQWRLGNDVMDSDHQALFGLLNELGDALANDVAESVIQTRLRRLVEFSARHFADEERIMCAGSFAGLESHRAEHQRLLADLAELAEHTHWVGASLTMRYLKNWLIGHMRSYDRAAAVALEAAAVGRNADAA